VRTEPVVLVHGWGGSFRRTWQEPGWEALLEDAGRRVIGVDLLGHGSAPMPHEPEAYADLTTAVTNAVGDERVDAIGFSLGAMTLLELACRAPERFGRLVVAGVGANVFRDDGNDSLVRAVEGQGDPDDVTAQLFAQYAHQPGNDPLALAACLRRPHSRDLSVERLAGVDLPVLVVLGDKDFAGPPDPLMAALPDARLVTLKGCDHFATPNDFRFIDAALEFLEAVPA
jgi:pimeloyl-ACP methyl ester carboxylesterase